MRPDGLVAVGLAEEVVGKSLTEFQHARESYKGCRGDKPETTAVFASRASPEPIHSVLVYETIGEKRWE